MGSVGAGFSMSLDGFIAGPNDDVGPLFAWYGSGDTEYAMPSGGMTVRVSARSAASLRELHAAVGAIVTGRRLFDLTDGWGGRHPMDVPIFVVTHRVPQEWVDAHRAAPFTFVTEGVEAAIAQAKAAAGDKSVGVAGPNVVQQALRAGLLDEVMIDLVPVLLGAGIRFFDPFDGLPVTLERISVVEGTGVTHLRFRVVE